MINMRNINSALFLEYIESKGFDPNNYNYILELVQSAPGSMSQFLSGYQQYLLSRLISYPELDELGIDGAFGYVEENGICVPKMLRNDDRFLYTPSKKIKKHGYGCPTIDQFDVFIANGVCPYLPNVANFSQDKFLGFCMDKNDENLLDSISFYENLLRELEKKSRDSYVLEHDTDTYRDKELYVLRKKR